MNEFEIFTEALLRTDPAERTAYLAQACGADTDLRGRIEKLLARHESAHPLLERRPGELLGALAAPDKTFTLASYLEPSSRPGALGRLGHYDVLEELGQGGFGVVVKAFDDSLHRVVAIKVLAPHLAATSPPRKRFLREARAAAKVKHEHVVQIYAVEEQPIPYLVMEYVEGQTLQQKLDAEGPLDPPEAARLGRQVALGLQAAHEKGLVHRDIKPANILLESGVEPHAKLGDFGLARTTDEASLTQSGVIAGTPMFMSPEQARGEELDHRADLFSFGSVLYTMATGRPPFRAPTALAVMKRVAEDDPRPIRQVVPEVPPGLCAVITRLLEKKPDARFASAREAAEALAVCLTAPPAPPASPRRARRLALAAGAVALVALATLAGWALLRRPGPKVEAEPPPPPGGAIVVTSAEDGDGPGTLRWAVAQANLRHGEDTIVFDPAAFRNPTTITLKQGPLRLLDPALTTITGPPAGLTLSGDDKSQAMLVGSEKEEAFLSTRVLVSNLTIARGRDTAEWQGGGGVLMLSGTTLTLIGCTLRDNVATHPNKGGGAVFNFQGTVVLVNCTLANNKGDEGGAIKNFMGTVKATNCTFAGNSARFVAGIWTGGQDRGHTELYNCVFANTGIDLEVRDQSEQTGDHNLTGDGSAPGPNSKPNTSARLGPLGRYGGPTETMPLLSGSPAVGAGDASRLPDGVRTDQRGRPRARGGKVDLGAFEAQ